VTVTQDEVRNDRFIQFPPNDIDFQRRLDERFSRMEEQFALIASQLGKKSQGKGKKIQKPQPSTSGAAASRLRSYMHEIGASSRASSDLFTDDEDRPLRPRPLQNQLTTEKTIYIKKIECFLNNTPIDQGMLIQSLF